MKNINIEDVLFFDLEVVRNQKELDINSKEFELYQKKTRNKETDELPTDKETVEHYNKFAGLKMTYNKIVCATVGRVVSGVLYLRSYTGEEKEILQGLYSKFTEAPYLSGMNILAYDLPLARVNSLRYSELSEAIPFKFFEAGRKPWDFDKTIFDLMNWFKGTHYANSSLDEICFHLGIPSSKSDIDGSQVSEVFYTEGVDRVEKYCKADVFATVNVFCRLQGRELFESFVDANSLSTAEPEAKETPVLERIYNSKELTLKDKEDLEKLLSKKKMSAKDKKIITEIITKLYINCEMFKADSTETQTQKELQIQNIIDEITSA